MEELFATNLIRISTLILFQVLILLVILQNDQKIKNHFDISCWYTDGACLFFVIFFIFIGILWFSLITYCKPEMCNTIDIAFESVLLFLFLTVLALWSFSNLKLSKVCITITAIIMILIVIITFNIKKGYGILSLIATFWVICQVAFISNLKERRLNND